MSTILIAALFQRIRSPGALVSCPVFVSLALIFFVAPTEMTMGHVQRILYLHVAVAWCGLTGCITMAVCGAMFLVRSRLNWDFWSQAAGEVGWLCTTLTLVTGSAWAHEAWGTWWTWEPRLTSMLLLWIMFAGIFLVRSAVDDPRRRSKVSAILAILAATDVPLIFMATRWFRGVHPVSPEMEPAMRYVLIASVLSASALFTFLVARRQQVLAMTEMLEASIRRSVWER
jgi:heme exporter protein C